MDQPLVTTRYGPSSTADDVLEGVDLTGVRAVVTGASSGLGAETARALAAAGAAVTLAVRDVAAGTRVADAVEGGGARRPEVGHLDLADGSSVRRFVRAWEGSLHLLVLNAGVVTSGLERTAEGRERQMATNHLGHHALAVGLHHALARGAAERDGSRVVVLSSTAHMRADVDLDDLDLERTAYDPQVAYARSKTANVLFAVEATRRWQGDGVVANAVNPGGVVTGLQRHFSPGQRASLEAAEAAGAFVWKSVGQGAATTVVAAVAPELAHTGGHYLDECREAYTVDDDASLVDHPHGVKRWALDPGSASRLWSLSEGLTRP
ncbi:NAD(P)-dependent dehydrogenase, short-chain alcohol dehydrogenase family [Microlunatus sagamiharensis]|uniref:Probable oxidoreductase n=1 Tax=Microlunatus sagamiharensis TaxID=546874 RepID=A0A1H2LSD3_9ACTN|nr:SDR family NAD(P)-dependent oxidoreductase [Microlunatus sagamiharensis]SDU83608.1 NAD(P)-dependent dehydrogenase, short-chain alcohol dehydrogenase family [Microlunatus sagamiharensis]